MTGPAQERSTRVGVVVGSVNFGSSVPRDVASVSVSSLALNSLPQIPSSMLSREAPFASVSPDQVVPLIVNLYVTRSVADRAEIKAAMSAEFWAEQTTVI